MRRTVLAFSLAVLASFSAAQTAGQWKWRDASGQLHVSDLPPPPSVPAANVLGRPEPKRDGRPVVHAKAPTAPASAASARPAAPATDPELDARRKRAEDEKVAQQKQQADKDKAVRAENCARARTHLAALNDGLRLTRLNAQGEREVLDDKGRAEEVQRARAIVASDCK